MAFLHPHEYDGGGLSYTDALSGVELGAYIDASGSVNDDVGGAVVGGTSCDDGAVRRDVDDAKTLDMVWLGASVLGEEMEARCKLRCKLAFSDTGFDTVDGCALVASECRYPADKGDDDDSVFVPPCGSGKGIGAKTGRRAVSGAGFSPSDDTSTFLESRFLLLQSRNSRKMMSRRKTATIAPMMAPHGVFEPPDGLVFVGPGVVDPDAVGVDVGLAPVVVNDPVVVKTGTLSEPSNSNLSRRNSVFPFALVPRFVTTIVW